MKILITGGAGYIGSLLTHSLLSQNHTVRVLDNLSHGGTPLLGTWSHPNFQFVRGDIRNLDLVKQCLKDTEALVHLAAIVGDPACSRQPDLARAINLEASRALIEESQKAGLKRMIFASTCSNYGKMKDSNSYVDETSVLAPVSLYAETKVAIEHLVLDPVKTPDICATSLRLATVFGVSSRMRFDLTVNEFTMEMLIKKKLVVFGEKFWRPYIHVRDVVRAMTLVLESPEEKINHRVFNVGSTDQNFTKKHLVEFIRPHAPDASVDYIPKEEDPRNYKVSFAKIEQELGFKISKTVPQGIEEIVQLVRDGVITDFSHPSFKN